MDPMISFEVNEALHREIKIITRTLSVIAIALGCVAIAVNVAPMLV